VHLDVGGVLGGLGDVIELLPKERALVAIEGRAILDRDRLEVQGEEAGAVWDRGRDDHPNKARIV
jgi:hypothetical protein